MFDLIKDFWVKKKKNLEVYSIYHLVVLETPLKVINDNFCKITPKLMKVSLFII